MPVGLVASSWGGTPAESWTRVEVMRGNPDLAPIVDHWDAILAQYPGAKAAYDEALAKWRVAKDAAAADGAQAPRKPSPPPGPDHPHQPGVLWNGMIAPLVPMTFRGVIWYQGESNADRGWQYAELFPAMIRDWRKQFGQGDVPFGFVQLAAFDGIRSTRRTCGRSSGTHSSRRCERCATPAWR